ncbi:hypothetical protein LI328DRAFT_138387 [Trichoderma asperelloides]|nr:hypothetical protein LI328DRAFT_138387 [Trichoderma asperelloides]
MRETGHQFRFPLFSSIIFRLFVFLSTKRYFFPKLHVGSTLSVWLGQSRFFISISLLRHPNSELSSPDPSSASPLNTARLVVPLVQMTYMIVAHVKPGICSDELTLSYWAKTESGDVKMRLPSQARPKGPR